MSGRIRTLLGLGDHVNEAAVRVVKGFLNRMWKIRAVGVGSESLTWAKYCLDRKPQFPPLWVERVGLVQ